MFVMKFGTKVMKIIGNNCLDEQVFKHVMAFPMLSSRKHAIFHGQVDENLQEN